MAHVRRRRRRRLDLLSFGGLAVFVASLNTESDVEEALNEKYDADITFERYRRQQEITVDDRDSPCRVEGEIGNLDDVRLVCTPPEEPSPLRGTVPSPAE